MRRFTLNSIMLPYLFCPINFLTEVAHKTKLVRQHVSGATCPVQIETGRRNWESPGLFPFPCTSVPGTLLFHHDTAKTITRPELWPSPTMCDFFFSGGCGVKSLWPSGTCTVAQNQKLSGTGFCDATLQSLDGLTRTTDVSMRPWQQTLGCLPSPLASQL